MFAGPRQIALLVYHGEDVVDSLKVEQVTGKANACMVCWVTGSALSRASVRREKGNERGGGSWTYSSARITSDMFSMFSMFTSPSPRHVLGGDGGVMGPNGTLLLAVNASNASGDENMPWKCHSL